MKIIPAIDLLDGKVVRLKKGAYNDVSSYNTSPVEQAVQYVEAGFTHLHIVDLNGARDGKFINLPVVKNIISTTGASIQTGGGIRIFSDCQQLFDAGISKIVSSSMAVKNEPDWIKALHEFGGDKCILGMDLKNGKIAYSGWTETADESTDSFLKRMISEGLQEVLCTDISRDGMLSGVNINLYKQLQNSFPDIRFIASGGVSGEKDLQKLSELDIYAVVIGRAYYEGHLSLDIMKSYHG
ncbi:MAG TPA: 1-(5-phosphoribosyl)-5-[(5-phosphoribosylamino)methylideneamino]imidazole-4-carboxamide isomerase [Balneolales bacterium]|nr:1-(5-phosphoribosyl)-5-[(5-phosphoribosylamino)methylideneamino]imidazole-4-carboxamide isomerase [Balneolales bacterium]